MQSLKQNRIVSKQFQMSWLCDVLCSPSQCGWPLQNINSHEWLRSCHVMVPLLQCPHYHAPKWKVNNMRPRGGAHQQCTNWETKRIAKGEAQKTPLVWGSWYSRCGFLVRVPVWSRWSCVKELQVFTNIPDKPTCSWNSPCVCALSIWGLQLSLIRKQYVHDKYSQATIRPKIITLHLVIFQN